TQNPVVGATVSVFGTYTSTTGTGGLFMINGVPTVRGNIVVQGNGTVSGKNAFGSSASVAPVPNGTTAVGDVTLVPLSGTITVLPYVSTGYKYSVVSHGQGSGFEQSSFDDSGFSTGDAAFGNGGG